MIGKTVSKDGVDYVIVGFDEGRFILQDVQHAAAFSVTARELRADYKGARAARAPKVHPNESGWRVLSDRIYALVNRKPRKLSGPTPEDQLRAAGTAAAKARAAALVAEGEDRIAEFETGAYVVPDAVAVEVDRILSESRAD